jgi:molecular chaperone GrpE
LSEDDDPLADLEDAPAGRPGQPEVSAPEPVIPPLDIPPLDLPPVELAADPGANLQLEGRVRLAEERLAEVLKAYRTLKTDNESFRDRTTRNLERRFEQRRESLLLKFIDILDNLDRALEAAQTAYADQSLLEGLILVRTQLLQTLQDEGLERIPVLGMPFDPHVSEAVETASVDEIDQNGIVVKELMRGYRLNGRVARVSRVVTAEYRAAGRTAADAAPEAPVAAAPAAIDEPEIFDAELTLDDIISQTEEFEPEPGRKPPARGDG